MFYEFHQNNSGGRFAFNGASGISEYVIAEAASPADANDRAESIGLYFDGEGDCPCCGNRWSALWRDEAGTETPELYGKPLSQYRSLINWMGKDPDCFVHYLDGRVEAHKFPARDAG